MKTCKHDGCMGACGCQLSPAEINQKQRGADHDAKKKADAVSNHPNEGIKEHGLKIKSRTNGKTVDVGFGPQGSNLVPANPFASLAQAGFLHVHPEKLGKAGLAEWDKASKGKTLPKKVK